MAKTNYLRASEQAVATRDPSEYTNDKLTLELQGVSIFDVLKIMSEKSGLNIVAGKNVQGQVSIFLQDVPIKDALKTILQSQGLASIEEDGILKVITEEEYLQKYGEPYDDKRLAKTFHLRHASAESVAAKLSDWSSRHGKLVTELRTNSILITDLPEIIKKMESFIVESDRPHETKVFQLRYVDVETIEPKIKILLEGSGGKFDVDKRSNQLIVIDIPSRIEKVESFINALDVPLPQVLIESRIVEVQLDDAFRQGINWQRIAATLGEKTLTAALPLTVAPPVGVAALTTLMLGESGDDLQVVLSLLERVGKTNLLSSPRITVINNEEAKLAVATREPFVSQTVVQTANSTNTADNVQFIDVGVTLKVQPKISRDDLVEMKIRPEISSSNSSIELEGAAEGSNTTFTRTRIPVVTTQELETTVSVKSGTTLIIGGLIQDKQTKTASKIPLLGSIPVIGRAFQSRANDFRKTELVLFLTPTILRPDQSHEKSESRFLNDQDEILPFDQFGGYPFEIEHLNPMRYRKTGETPYWEFSLLSKDAAPQHENGLIRKRVHNSEQKTSKSRRSA